MTTADNQPLGQALAENQAFLQTMFGGSSDFYTKSFTICGCRCCIAMFAGLSSPEKLCIMVLHALGQGVPGCKAGPQLVQYLAEQSCLPTEQTPITTRTQLVEALAGGMAVLLAFPPSPFFVSEVMLFRETIAGGRWWVAGTVLLLLCIVIYSVCYRIVKLCYQPNQDSLHPAPARNALSWAAFSLLAAAMVVGIWQPALLQQLIDQIVSL